MVEPEQDEMAAISSPASSKARIAPSAEIMAPLPPVATRPIFLPSNALTVKAERGEAVSNAGYRSI